jgi:hypothetical protein
MAAVCLSIHHFTANEDQEKYSVWAVIQHIRILPCIKLFHRISLPSGSHIIGLRRNLHTMAVNKKGSTPTTKEQANENRTVKQVLVGGPLLGSRQRKIASDFAAWDRFEPIITPQVQFGEKQDQTQRFILLPHSRHITVLAYQTGAQIATLVPFLDDDEARDSSRQVVIESVCLANYSRKIAEKTIQDVLTMEDSDNEETERSATLGLTVDEVIVLAGCRDGSLREFSLRQLGNSSNSGPVQCGSYHVAGRYLRPRRVVSVTKGDPIMHVTSPRIPTVIEANGVLTYMVIRTKDLAIPVDMNNVKTEQNMNIKVLRVLLPFYSGNSKVSLIQKEEGDIQRKWQVDNFRCRVGRDKAGGFMNTTPFRLLSVVNSGVQDCPVFVVVAQANTVNVYLDHAVKRERYPPMQYPMPVANPITSIHISPNNDDIACGHFFGEITVMNGVLSDVEKYYRDVAKGEQQNGSRSSVNKPTDPRTKLITSKTHWHAHSVGSLCYDSMSSPMDPVLYSGGTESVLVTWQMAQGRSRPLHFLPRVSLGAIIHVVCADKVDDRPSNGILVYSDDNTLQLFESHSKGRLWRIQGLACNMKDTDQHHAQKTTIEVDPLSKGAHGANLVITGLPQAPGFIHWYDPSRRCLTATLEVAPFNKVSKTEAEDDPMPIPCISSYTFCNDGKELITIDETPTENVFVGAYDHKGQEGAYGVVTTIRFWAWNETPSSKADSLSRSPYTLTAAMSFPHGPRNLVSALASSTDGRSACTVSNDEKAFRLWKKVIVDDDEDTRRTPAWTCAYKVTIPAGFSNFPTHRNGVAFSEDGSTLALSRGNMVTLWDCEEARFLGSIRHLEGAAGIIDSLEFISIGVLKDLLLIKSDQGVSVQSPLGSRSIFKGWSWGVPWATKHAIISSVEFLERESCLAMSVYDSKEGHSRLVVVDGCTGNPRGIGNVALGLVDGIEGRVVSLSAAGKITQASRWDDKSDSDENGMRLYCLTDNGSLSLFIDTEDAQHVEMSDANSLSVGPTLAIANRKRGADQKSLAQWGPLSKKGALEVFGLVNGTESKALPPMTSELPFLSKNFVRAFVGRGLLKVKGP